MEWALVFVLAVLASVLAYVISELRAPYSSLGDLGGTMYGEFYNYLFEVEAGVRARREAVSKPTYDELGERRPVPIPPERPDRWKLALTSPKDRNLHRAGSACAWLFCATTIEALARLFNHGRGLAGIFDPMHEVTGPELLGLVAAGVCLYAVLKYVGRRDYVEGITQGYLDGYAAAHRDVLERKEQNREATPPTVEQLRQLVPHVAFEVVALDRSAALFTANPHWVILEDFLLHARNVREFLWQRWEPEARFAQSAVYAEHYFPNAVMWRNARGGPPPIVRDTDDAIDKQLSHITRERADPNEFTRLEDKVIPLKSALIDQWSRFMSMLKGTEWRDLFDRALAEKQSTLPSQ